MKKIKSLVILCFILGAALSAQEKTKRPNILFAICDDVSYPHTSFAGSKFVNTPSFDRVAREGIYFENCYAGSPGCAPSRSSIVTGRHPWQNEQSGQHGSSWMKKYVPFTDELKNNGYAVGLTGKGVDPFKYASSEKDSLWRKENAAGTYHSKIVYKGANDKRVTNKISDKNYFENFKYFMENVKEDKPFFFWYGGHEAHRGYEKDSWKRTNKKLSDVEVPSFFPDTDVIRGDLLDYAVEIEWFDLHLTKMLTYLEAIGELENTVVIVTSDNGMPFPRAKANCYDYGVHVPLAIRYPKEFSQNKRISQPVGFVELAPTILEIAQVVPSNMQPITGESLLKVLKGKEKLNTEKAVFSGRERHTSARYENMGYPQRSIRKGDYLLIWNMKPKRWPAGAPKMFSKGKEEGELVDNVYADIDGSPSKSFLIKNKNSKTYGYYFDLATDKRPEFELYNIEKDYACLNNLSGTNVNKKIEEALKQDLMRELVKTKEPRVVGPNKEIFDSYKRYSSMRYFPKPN
jgi:N-sulfoglucosamine sulfohydrolase